MHNFIIFGISCDSARTTSIIEKHLSKSHSIASSYFTAAAGFSVAQEIGSAQDEGEAGIVIVGIDTEEAAAQVRAAGGSVLHVTTPIEYFKLRRCGGDDVLFDYDCQSILLEEIDDLISKKVLRLQRELHAA